MFSSLKVIASFNPCVCWRPTYSCLVFVRSYCRWVHRRPARVFLPEDIENGKPKSRRAPSLNIKTNTRDVQSITGNEADVTLDQSCDVRKRIAAYEKQLEHAFVPKDNEMNEQSDKSPEIIATKNVAGSSTPPFTKLNDDDPLFSKLMSSVKSKKQRDKKGYILLEGKRLITDCIAAGIIPQYVFFSNVNSIAHLGLTAGTTTKLYKIPYKTISLWSDVTTSQGVIAICKMPAVESIEPPDEVLPLTVVCDNVREPGNLGVILRTAVGVGCQQVVLTKGCMDPWDPKVLRSGASAHFRMKIFKDVMWEELSDILGKGFVCLADNNMNGSLSAGEDECNDDEIETTPNSEAMSSCVTNNLVPIVPYYSVDYSQQASVVLVIGGEAHGLSESAYKLAASWRGVRVNIPLNNGMESLNTGTALGVIVFEMKRQFLTKHHHEYYRSNSLAETSV